MEDDIRLSSRTLEAALKSAKAERRFHRTWVEAVVVEFFILARRGPLKSQTAQAGVCGRKLAGYTAETSKSPERYKGVQIGVGDLDCS